MYKIMIYINTYSGDKWFYYQENEKDYVARSLHEIKETVLTLIDTYGKDNIKIVKQITGEDMEGSVETFIYDSTDNYEELENRPSINGVEIIGELSLAELGIQPAGDYATNAKVSELEQTVNNIDFTPYATNERVDQVEYKVDNMDLTSYATNERVDQVEDRIDNINLDGFYTKEETDAKDNERLRGYFWDYKGNCMTIGSSLEGISQSQYGTTFKELSNLWDQIAVGGMHPIEVKDKNNYRAWLMPSGTAGGSTYVIYKFRGQVILNTPSSAADAGLYRSYYLELRVNRDDNKLWQADFLCKEGYEQPSMARVEAYVQEQIDGIDFSASDENITGVKTFSVLPRSTVAPTSEDELTNKSYVDHGVESCASKEYVAQYVDDSISSINLTETDPTVPAYVKAITEEQITKWDSSGDSSPTLIYEFDLANADQDFTSGEIALNADQLERLKTIIQELLDNGAKGNYNILLYNSEKRDGRSVLLSEQVLYQLSNLGRSYTFQYAQFSGINTHGNIFQTSTEAFTLRLEIVIMNDNLVIDRINNAWIYWNNGVILTTASNRFYEPFEDYNPATKKYVDDSIAAIDISTGSDNYYTKEEADAAIAAAITGALGGEY